nr:tumor necrosis factor receptor superfamily member 14-like isoform X1 [Paramormyrops kingsleyae]
MEVLFFTLFMLVLLDGIGSLLAMPHSACPENMPLCPPGTHRLKCGCAPCTLDTFTAFNNTESRCMPCYRDCREDLHMEIVKRCSATSNTVCKCQDGYTCVSKDSQNNCEVCEPQPSPSGLVKLITTKATDPTASCEPGAFYSESFRKCQKHKNCTSLGLSIETAGNSTHDTVCGNPIRSAGTAHERVNDTKWWHILVGVFTVFLCIAVVLRLFWKLEDGACLKQIIKISAPDGHMKGNHCPPQDASKSFGALCGQTPNYCGRPENDHQPDCPLDTSLGPDSVSQGAGNLGPFHIYSAGTVFVSLLNHVTGFEKEAEEERKGEKKTSDWLGPAPVPSSPPVHLSEEERDGQSHSIFFPSQEQGKETHLSKEERM